MPSSSFLETENKKGNDLQEADVVLAKTETVRDDSTITYPDGGFEAWTVVFGVSVLTAIVVVFVVLRNALECPVQHCQVCNSILDHATHADFDR